MEANWGKQFGANDTVSQDYTYGILRDSNGKVIQSKPVIKRNLAFHVLASLFILFFGLFWMFEIDKESKAITQKTDDTSSCKVVIFSIITLGLYSFYWIYKVGKRQSEYYDANVISDKSKLARIYLLISVIGFIAGGLLSTTISKLLTPILPSFLTGYVAVLLYSPIMLCAFAMVFGIMQSNNNNMLAIEQSKGHGKVYVRNSDILNKVFWGTLFLFVMSQTLLTAFMSLGQGIIRLFQFGNIDNFSLPNNIQAMIQKAAQDVANCNHISVMLPNLFMIAGGFVLLLVFMYWFRHGKYDGVLKCENFWKALLLCLPGFVMCALNIVDFFIEGGCNFKIGLIILGFVPGVTEEVAFRGMIVPNIIRIFNRKTGIYVALIVSSLLFGFVHAGNIFAGADTGTTWFQVLYASAIGFLFAAVLIRTGNLWVSILCHGLMDTLAYMSPSALVQGAIQTQAFSWDAVSICVCVFCALLIAYSFFLVRSKKHEEIMVLWQRKFGSAMLRPL